MSWVYVGGTFDLLHYGHMRLFYEAGAYGPVVVSLNTDEFAARYKRRPVLTLEERIESVRGCRYVDEVVVNEGDEDSKVAIDLFQAAGRKVRWIAHGDDWTGESLAKQMGLSPVWLEENGIEMLYLPYTPGISSSRILERAKAAARFPEPDVGNPVDWTEVPL